MGAVREADLWDFCGARRRSPVARVAGQSETWDSSFLGLADAEAEHALGQRNAQVIVLFERYCANVRVEVMGGTGMLEAATGLPIGHRAFRCAYAPGGVQ